MIGVPEEEAVLLFLSHHCGILCQRICKYPWGVLGVQLMYYIKKKKNHGCFFVLGGVFG